MSKKPVGDKVFKERVKAYNKPVYYNLKKREMFKRKLHRLCALYNKLSGKD